VSGGQILWAVGDGDGPSGVSAGAGRVLGARLRQLRKDQGLRLVDVVKAGMIGSAATLSRVEKGETPLKPERVLALAMFYNVSDPVELATLEMHADRQKDVQWWEEFRDVIPGWTQRLLSVEASAESIRTYEMQYVPGLLQTSRYAEALVRHAIPAPFPEDPGKQEEHQKRTVEVREKRQALLKEPGAPEYFALLDEGVLARPVGGRVVMRQQLRKLYDQEENEDRIHIRIMPFSTGDHGMAPAPGVTHLQFSDGGHEADMVYLETRYGGSYLTNPEEVTHYKQALSGLWSKALTRKETLGMLEEYIARLRD